MLALNVLGISVMAKQVHMQVVKRLQSGKMTSRISDRTTIICDRFSCVYGINIHRDNRRSMCKINR